MREQLDQIQDEQNKQREKCGNFQADMATLLEMQKNTTRNVDSLAQDVKGLLKNALHFEVLDKKIDATNIKLTKTENEVELLDISKIKRDITENRKDIDTLEKSRTWGFRLITGALAIGIIKIIIDMEIYKFFVVGGG